MYCHCPHLDPTSSTPVYTCDLESRRLESSVLCGRRFISASTAGRSVYYSFLLPPCSWHAASSRLQHWSRLGQVAPAMEWSTRRCTPCQWGGGLPHNSEGLAPTGLKIPRASPRPHTDTFPLLSAAVYCSTKRLPDIATEAAPPIRPHRVRRVQHLL